jgi:hypothetical protein
LVQVQNSYSSNFSFYLKWPLVWFVSRIRGSGRPKPDFTKNIPTFWLENSRNEHPNGAHTKTTEIHMIHTNTKVNISHSKEKTYVSLSIQDWNVYLSIWFWFSEDLYLECRYPKSIRINFNTQRPKMTRHILDEKQETGWKLFFPDIFWKIKKTFLTGFGSKCFFVVVWNIRTSLINTFFRTCPIISDKITTKQFDPNPVKKVFLIFQKIFGEIHSFHLIHCFLSKMCRVIWGLCVLKSLLMLFRYQFCRYKSSETQNQMEKYTFQSWIDINLELTWTNILYFFILVLYLSESDVFARFWCWMFVSLMFRSKREYVLGEIGFWSSSTATFWRKTFF